MKPDSSQPWSTGPVTRRTFMSKTIAAAAALMGISQTLAADTARPSNVKISPYSYLALSRQVGTSFNLHTPKGRAIIILADVVENRCDAQLQQYTASFQIKGKRVLDLPQEVYELRHNKLGQLSLLLTPVTENGRQTFIASFSHLKS